MLYRLTKFIFLFFFQIRKIYHYSNERTGMKYLLLIVLLMAVVITAGCVGGNKETVVTPTPQIIYVTVTVTPTQTTLNIIPRYQQGDIIDFSPNIDKVPHLIILDYNNKTGQYQFDRIFRNENRSWGYRLYPEPQWNNMESIEKNHTYLIDHINLTGLETRFQSREIFEKT